MTPATALPGPELASRWVAAERDCYVAWAEALAVVPGNPLEASVHRFGSATAVICPGSRAASLNRVIGLRDEDRDQVAAIRQLFAAHQVPARIDVDPYGYYAPGEGLLAALARAGLLQTGFQQLLWGGPVLPPGGVTPDMAILAAGPENAEAYGRIHEEVFGPGGLITPLLTHPEFHCFLATVGGKPAGMGVLHVRGRVASLANGITVPAFRRRGIQIALLRHRLAVAADLGCDLLVSQAAPGSESMRNQLRVGLMIGGTKAVWTLPSA